jgi:hypothetical protein
MVAFTDGFIIMVIFWAPVVTCKYLFPSVIPYSVGEKDSNDIPFNIIGNATHQLPLII